MTFVLGKLAYIVLRPANLLVLVALLGLVGLGRGGRAWARLCLAFSVGTLALVTLLPVGSWLLVPLENRFPRPAPPERVDGVVVLGGGLDAVVTAAREGTALGEPAERYTTLLAMIRRYPEARIVFTGGVGRLAGAPMSEAEVVAGFLREQGVPEGRVILEGRSRTTFENVRLARDLVGPRPGERWLLVTSAAHMPRSVGLFRAAGWPVEPWPVDYRTTGRVELDATIEADERLSRLHDASYEWLGLVYYRLLGRTDELFPGPRGGPTKAGDETNPRRSRAMSIKSAREMVAAADGAVERLTAEEAASLVGTPDVQFLDVREPAEWAQGHVPGAVHVPRGLLEFQVDPSLPGFKGELAGKRVVVYCASGGRSALAAKTLQDMGYDGVAHLQGGMTAWVQSGKPTSS